jgi:hypothetical protein
MMHGIENAAGYDGFALARYSRLAGDMKVWGDLENPARSLFISRELDLLNVRYVIARRPHYGSPEALPVTRWYNGYGFADASLDAPYLDGGKQLGFIVPSVMADHLALLTNLSWSVDVPDGTVVAYVRLRTEEGDEITLELRAGEHTAEWAHDRPAFKNKIRHRRAPVATTFEVKGEQYEGHDYLATFRLPKRAIIVGGSIEVARVAPAPQLGIAVLRASLVDEATGTTSPLRNEWLSEALASPNEKTCWRRVEQTGNLVVYENINALPRVWLASEAVTQPDDVTLQVIRTGKLSEGTEWEPRRTALIDVKLPLELASADAQGQAEITRYEPNRIEVRARNAATSILVLSENHYSGWRASVDGRAVETMRVDYNLRGVLLPPGDHQVRFVYHPKSVYLGLMISLFTAAVLALWCSGRFDERARRLFIWTMGSFRRNADIAELIDIEEEY